MIDFAKEENKLKDIVKHLEEELKELRTGRAHIGMVENIMVDAYGNKSPLVQMASLATPDPRTILIKPWDKSLMPAIEQALAKSNIGANPIAEKEQIRMVMPPPTEERRRDLVKILGKKLEEARITIRQNRDDIWKTIQEEAREGIISEDQKFSQKEKMEQTVEAINKAIAEIADKKEKEIMEI